MIPKKGTKDAKIPKRVLRTPPTMKTKIIRTTTKILKIKPIMLKAKPQLEKPSLCSFLCITAKTIPIIAKIVGSGINPSEKILNNPQKKLKMPLRFDCFFTTFGFVFIIILNNTKVNKTTDKSQ